MVTLYRIQTEKGLESYSEFDHNHDSECECEDEGECERPIFTGRQPSRPAYNSRYDSLTRESCNSGDVGCGMHSRQTYQ